MPSSLTTVHLDRLGILYLTTCVGLGYGPQQHSLEAFLGSMGSPYFASIGYASPLTHVIQDRHPDLPRCRATGLHQDNHRLAGLPSCVTPSLTYYRIGSHAPPTTPPRRAESGFGWLASPASARTHRHEHGNINPLSIDYACRPRLRSRLTLGGQTWPRNPWSFGGRDSHSAFATHACILTPTPSTAPSHGRFTRCRTLPYPTPPTVPKTLGIIATASAVRLSPATLSAQDHLTSELLRTL